MNISSFNIFDLAGILQNETESAALCTVVSVRGSTPRKTGAKMLVMESGKIYGTIGGGDLEKKVMENARAVIKNKKPQMFRHDLLHQHNMCCGGTVEIFIEPILKKNRLYIFGAGHTGKILGKFAAELDFEVVVIDNRKEYISEITDPGIHRIHREFEQALKFLPFDESTFITIMTYSHPVDREILAYCIKKPHAYLGMMGSMRKVELTKKNFVEGGIASKEEIESVDMPMGINIRSESPAEIAISVLAKLIDTRSKVLK